MSTAASASVRLGALLCLGFLAACSGKKVVVERVDVDDEGLKEAPDLAWPEATAKSELEAQLKKAHFTLLGEGESAPEHSVRMKLELQVAEDEADDLGPDEVDGGGASPAAVEVGASLELRIKGDPERRTLTETGRRKVNGEGLEERRTALQGAAKSALEKLAGEAYALVKASTMNDEELVKQLDARSLSDKHAAVRILAERKNKAAVAPLLEQLKLDDDNLVRQAIGQLVDIGDPRAVPGMIEAAHGKNEIFQREVVFAVGAIGGEDAEAYLFTVSSGSPSDSLRAAADQSLKELKARQAKNEDAGT